jgi:hypothetical protein
MVRKLVLTGQLTVPERQALGSRDVHWTEVAAIIREAFEQCRRFPANQRRWTQGSPVYEGAILEEREPRVFEITLQRSYAINPQMPADTTTTTYPDLELAIGSFIDKEWPRGIDGIRIDRTNRQL